MYKQLVVSSNYPTTTKSYLSFAVSYISRFVTATNAHHWMVAKKILRSVNGTLKYGILYDRGEDFLLRGYTDSNWVVSVDD